MAGTFNAMHDRTGGTATTGRPGGPAATTSGGGSLMEKAQDAVTGAAEKAQDWASGAVDTAKDWASGAAEKVQDWGSTAAQGAGSAATATWDAARGAEQNLEVFIRRHPLQSLLIAFGVGCLAGMCLRNHS